MFNFNRLRADDKLKPRGLINSQKDADEVNASRQPSHKPATEGRKKIFHGLPDLDEAARNSLARRGHHPFERQGR